MYERKIWIKIKQTPNRMEIKHLKLYKYTITYVCSPVLLSSCRRY